MSLTKFLSLFFISSALLIIVTGRPHDDFSSEDDRINEIGGDFARKFILPNVERIFSSAESQSSRRTSERSSNSIKNSEKETTKSSKHAHGMITSMLKFVSNVFGFGLTFMRDE